MLPYFEAPSFEIAGFTLTAFRLLVLLAVAIQFEVTVRRAPRFGIASDTATSLVGWSVVLGLISAHVLDVVMYYPERLIADPLELFRTWGSLSSTGGMLGGVAGLWVVARIKRLDGPQFLGFMDVLHFALPFTLATGRLGCALQHDHLGLRSDHFLAVAFPDGPRFDLGLLEFLWVAAIAIGFLLLDRKPRAVGFWVAAFFAAYGPARILMDMLRTDDARYFGATPAQYLMAVATLAAVTWLIRNTSNRPEASDAQV